MVKNTQSQFVQSNNTFVHYCSHSPRQYPVRSTNVVSLFQTWCLGCCAAVSRPTTTSLTRAPAWLSTRRTTGPWSGSSPVRRWSTGARWVSVTRTAGTGSVTTSGTTWIVWSTCNLRVARGGECGRFLWRDVIVIHLLEIRTDMPAGQR